MRFWHVSGTFASTDIVSEAHPIQCGPASVAEMLGNVAAKVKSILLFNGRLTESASGDGKAHR